MKPLLVREVNPPLGANDGVVRRYGLYICSECNLNSYICRMDSPNKFCADCRCRFIAERRNQAQVGAVYGQLTFVALLATIPPKYRSYGKFHCSCGKAVKAEMRRVLSGEKYRCGAKCGHTK